MTKIEMLNEVLHKMFYKNRPPGISFWKGSYLSEMDAVNLFTPRR